MNVHCLQFLDDSTTPVAAFVLSEDRRDDRRQRSIGFLTLGDLEASPCLKR
jgi:hypothetical protein